MFEIYIVTVVACFMYRIHYNAYNMYTCTIIIRCSHCILCKNVLLIYIDTSWIQYILKGKHQLQFIIILLYNTYTHFHKIIFLVFFSLSFLLSFALFLAFNVYMNLVLSHSIWWGGHLKRIPNTFYGSYICFITT